MELDERNVDVREVQKLLAEGAIARCFARHKLLLDRFRNETGINLPSKTTERIQYLVAEDQYIEIKLFEEKVSFRLFKVIASKN